jgi:catechol 2,3-dioxygenase-like lactoylglutathione lyase family enzyme
MKSESDMRPKINSAMVGFSVRDIKAAVDFYTTKLGFQAGFKNGAVFAIVSRDGIEISLALDKSGAKAGKGSCYLKVSGVEALHDELRGRNVEMTHPLKTESYGMREFMIADPDGNTLNFGEPVQ